MKRNFFAVFETDRNLMQASRKLIAVCTSQRTAVSLALNELIKAKKIKTTELAHYRTLLTEQNQTQGFEVNYLIENIEPNKLLQQ